MAGLSAHAKGVSLGIIEPKPELVRERGERLAEGERLHVDLLGRAVPVVRTSDGIRPVNKGKPGDPGQVERYLAGKYKDRLGGPWPRWRRPTRPRSCTGAGSGCTRRSAPLCPPASADEAPRASPTSAESAS